MSAPTPIYRFTGEAVQARTSTWTVMDWRGAVPFSILASTKAEAEAKAKAMIGAASPGLSWAIRCTSIEEVTSQWPQP